VSQARLYYGSLFAPLGDRELARRDLAQTKITAALGRSWQGPARALDVHFE
jgi:hypothetical protein